MARGSYKGANQIEGITGNQSGDNLTIVQQKNGVMRVKVIKPKRRKKKTTLVYTSNNNTIN